MPLPRDTPPFGGAGYDGEQGPATSNSDPSVAAPGGGFDAEAAAAEAASGAPLTTAWGKDYTSRAAIKERYRDEQGALVPLGRRVFDWRTEYVQRGDADLGGVLDYYLRWDEPKPGQTPGWRAKTLGEAGQVHRTQQRTVAGWLEEFRGASKEQMTSYQDALFAAGYYDGDVYANPAMLRKGRFDDATQAAFSKLLKDAIMTGNGGEPPTLKDLLQLRTEEVEERGGVAALAAQSGRAPLSAVVTNPLDVQASAEDSAFDLMGRTNVDASGMASDYQRLEQTAQQQDYAAGVSGGTTVGQPSLANYTDQRIKDENPVEVDAYATLGAMNELMRMLGGAG